MLDLESAIEHCEEVAEEHELTLKQQSEMNDTFVNHCKKCAEEHRQLAEWLKELKKYREKDRYNNYDVCLGGFHND